MVQWVKLPFRTPAAHITVAVQLAVTPLPIQLPVNLILGAADNRLKCPCHTSKASWAQGSQLGHRQGDLESEPAEDDLSMWLCLSKR